MFSQSNPNSRCSSVSSLQRLLSLCGTGVPVVPLAARPPTRGAYTDRTEYSVLAPDFLHAQLHSSVPIK